MLNGEDDNFIRFVVGCIIDQVAIMSRHQLAHTFDLLLPADSRKRDQGLEGRKNGGTDAKRGCGLWTRT